MSDVASATMRAVVLNRPGPPDSLTIRDSPCPSPARWVLIALRAFGLHRSELHTRLGLAAGRLPVLIARVYEFDQILQAHADMEAGVGSGKLVVTT